MRLHLLGRALMLGMALGAVLFGTIGSAGAETFGDIELEPCHLPNYRQEVLCGRHTVYENRAAAAGREIEIHFAVLPAVGEKPLPDPLVVFAGGPGQAAMEMAPFVTQAFSELGESRDVVLIDQRGMGSSHPLECAFSEDELVLDPSVLEEESRRAIRRCLEEWDADPTLYTQDLANEDIHEILDALGYTEVNLYGASWGTRSALLYAHHFPEHVRTVVLDGALPPRNPAPFHAAEDGDRALRALFADCAADAACRDAFPSLEEDFQSAVTLLGSGKEVTMNDPSTGEPQTFILTRDTFGGLLRNILYSPELSRILPLIIHRAAEGDYRALLGVSSFFATQSRDSMTLGASLAIFCAEEVARTGDVDPAADTLLGHALFEGIENACSVWPETSVPALYAEAIGSDAPTLILSGDVDPITPPRWGEAMAELLPSSLHLVSPHTGHNVSPVGCAPELIAQFVDGASVDGLDGSCLDGVERPSFFIDASGPAMTAIAEQGGDS